MSVMVGLRHARMILRANGRPLCRDGIESWCVKHGIDWQEFAGPGVPEEVMAAIDHHLVPQVIANAREEQLDERR